MTLPLVGLKAIAHERPWLSNVLGAAQLQGVGMCKINRGPSHLFDFIALSEDIQISWLTIYTLWMVAHYTIISCELINAFMG